MPVAPESIYQECRVTGLVTVEGSDQHRKIVINAVIRPAGSVATEPVNYYINDIVQWWNKPFLVTRYSCRQWTIQTNVTAAEPAEGAIYGHSYPGEIVLGMASVANHPGCLDSAYQGGRFMFACNDRGGRTPAHEFGHILGFEDSYAKKGVDSTGIDYKDIMRSIDSDADVQWYHGRVLSDKYR